MTELKTIAYFTEKMGVNPAVRKSVKEQALTMAHLDLSAFEIIDGMYALPIAIDEATGETLYLKISATVGTAPKAKAPKAKSESVVIPNLFD